MNPHRTDSVAKPWRVSLHGGHSGAYCDHAEGNLRDIIDAAVEAGYHTFGITEHAPRFEDRYLYAEERQLGWTVEDLLRNFDRYARELDQLAVEYNDRIHILRGFEAEVIPPQRYADDARALFDRYSFDYMVGSVHYVNDIIIDYTPQLFQAAVDRSGGLEALQVQYFRQVQEMVLSLRPAVVGHLDLFRRFAGDAPLSSAVLLAAREALDAVRQQGAILDVNTAAYRKGLKMPYPGPQLVTMARDLEIAFCFGDDSHRPAEVGAGLDLARAYLLEFGVKEVSCLQRSQNRLECKSIPL